MLLMERLDVDLPEFDRLTSHFGDREIHQTAGWISFVREAQGARPVLAVLKRGGRPVGYFSGLTIRKFGLKILGSPFPGWTTSYMGFNLDADVTRRAALEALTDFAFGPLGCQHLEVLDRQLTVEDAEALGFAHYLHAGFQVDLTRDEDALMAGMSGACRRCIRKARKCGVTVEEADDDDFASDYYAQLEDVFAKQSLLPTYTIERVRALIRNLRPTGNLLLLRAKDPEGRCIGTGIFPALNRTVYFWGGASWRQDQILRPNELVFWHAMLYWKARGIQRLDMGGAGEYKRKYGGSEIAIPWVRKSKYPWIMTMREHASRTYYRFQTLKGKWKLKGATADQSTPSVEDES